VNSSSRDPAIATFSDLREYPFLDEKYGHAEFLWGGAMEHQTCSSMGFWDEYAGARASYQWWAT
jgi:hypothetical protein